MRNVVKAMAMIAIAIALPGSNVFATPTCTDLGYNNVPHAKPNKLYVYFPPADDNAFPEFGIGTLHTSPAHLFKVTELSSYSATADPDPLQAAIKLQAAIMDVVTDDYCEFDVEVLQ